MTYFKKRSKEGFYSISIATANITCQKLMLIVNRLRARKNSVHQMSNTKLEKTNLYVLDRECGAFRHFPVMAVRLQTRTSAVVLGIVCTIIWKVILAQSKFESRSIGRISHVFLDALLENHLKNSNVLFLNRV